MAHPQTAHIQPAWPTFAAMAGAHATDLIAETTLALRMGASINDIATTIHAHPTLAEAIGDAALRMEEE